MVVEKEENNIRVDVFINKRKNDLSRTRVKKLILDKKLKINNITVIDPSTKVAFKDNIDLIIPEPKKFL